MTIMRVTKPDVAYPGRVAYAKAEPVAVEMIAALAAWVMVVAGAVVGWW